jgi:hypothetical protein
MITKEKITNMVYDTLMQNKKPPYVALDLSKIEDQECAARGGVILFRYCGIEFRIDINVKKGGLWL